MTNSGSAQCVHLRSSHSKKKAAWNDQCHRCVCVKFKLALAIFEKFAKSRQI